MATLRLNKVLRELNISLHQAIKYFNEINIEIETSPNEKISLEDFQLLNNYLNDNNKVELETVQLEEVKEFREAFTKNYGPGTRIITKIIIFIGFCKYVIIFEGSALF